MKLSDKYYDVGLIKAVDVITRDSVPYNFKNVINTKYAYKIEYFINLPGLIMPEFLRGSEVLHEGKHKLRLISLDETPLSYPKQNSPYTIIEPMRLSDFMDWQYKAAETLTETNKKLNDILTDETIADLKQTIANLDTLTARSTGTIDKVDALLDSSQDDINKLMEMTKQATDDFSNCQKTLTIS